MPSFAWIKAIKSFFSRWVSRTACAERGLMSIRSRKLKDQALVHSMGYQAEAPLTELNETLIMLVVLALIDVVMISNLLIMVIVGGYETFVSRMHLEHHPDQPEWLDHVNASVLKVKLGTAIIGISSIHLLKTFINAANYDVKVLMWQTIIHLTFLLSVLAIAYTDKILHSTEKTLH